MNRELTILWVNTVVGKFSFSRRLLAWDYYEAHMTDEIRATLKASTVDGAILPGGCTKYIQGPDLVWNKAFKASLQTSMTSGCLLVGMNIQESPTLNPFQDVKLWNGFSNLGV